MHDDDGNRELGLRRRGSPGASVADLGQPAEEHGEAEYGDDGDQREGWPGETVAVGKTPQALAMELQEKLRGFVNNPLVTIIPTQFVGLLARQIRVIGEAAQPRTLAYRSSMTTLDVLIEVGGLTRFADGDRAVIIRNVDGRQQSYRVRLGALVRDGDITQNVEMQPGDILIIPQRFF